VGSGLFTPILELAEHLCRFVSPDLAPEVIGVARVGDIRHCSSDLAKTNSVLGYSPKFSIEAGLRQIYQSVQNQPIIDYTLQAKDELKRAGMLK
jgi:dTDP-L-rhamnose 4-epimerase